MSESKLSIDPNIMYNQIRSEKHASEKKYALVFAVLPCSHNNVTMQIDLYNVYIWTNTKK